MLTYSISSQPAAARRFSLAVLAVELTGASALWPYALANVRAVFPTKDPEKWHGKTPEEKYADFGCTTPFDIFVLVPCYKVGWGRAVRWWRW